MYTVGAKCEPSVISISRTISRRWTTHVESGCVRDCSLIALWRGGGVKTRILRVGKITTSLKLFALSRRRSHTRRSRAVARVPATDSSRYLRFPAASSAPVARRSVTCETKHAGLSDVRYALLLRVRDMTVAGAFARSAVFIVSLLATASVAADASNRDACGSVRAEIAAYRPVAERVLSYVRDERGYKGRTWAALSDFTDAFGSRLAGTPNLERSIDYMLAKLNAERLDNVHAERVEFTGWQRSVVQPPRRRLLICRRPSSRLSPNHSQ